MEPLPEGLRLPVFQPAAVGATAPIPYEKTDRTPAPLQALERAVIEFLEVDGDRLVSLFGEICEHGSVVLFGEMFERGGGPDYRLYRVVSYDSRATGRGRHRFNARTDREQAEHLYRQRVEELS